MTDLANAKLNQVPVAGSGIAVFDFYSGPRMHLPFNEGYLRIVRAAFPEQDIQFHAAARHLENLAPNLAGLNVTLRPVPPFTVPFGWSRHNPFGSRLAAAACLRIMRRRLRGRPLLSALLGVDAGLYRVAGRGWSAAHGPLHILMHGSLAANYVWRSRNPLINAFDLRSSLRRRLAPGVRLVGLELGVAEAIADEAPVLRPAVATLEHPILQREWWDGAAGSEGPVSVGFLGFGSVRKGFDVFANLARRCARPGLAFDAVGHADAVPGLDTSALRRQLAPHSLSRPEYLHGLQALDIVCLPLESRSYDFAASGTVSDAIAALKPVLAFRNRTLGAIFDHYGPIGRLFESADEMGRYLEGISRGELEQDRAVWVGNLVRLRAARLPESLAAQYRALALG